jgi:hypothetical protein
MPLDDPETRAAWARDLVAKSAPKNKESDPRDTLSPFERDIVGGNSVVLKIPLRDPVELRRHLAMAEETMRELRLRLEQSAKDRSHLFMARAVIRSLHLKINPYRRPARE